MSKQYFLKDPVFYAPLNVLWHYNQHIENLPLHEQKEKRFRKANEFNLAAIALVGIQLDEGNQYWMQLVSDEEQSPDARSGRFLPSEDERAPHFTTQDIEVVSYMPKPGEDIASFLLRTKLDVKGKSYDEFTTILCHIPGNIHIPSLQQIARELSNSGAKCPVVILGRTHVTQDDYTLFQVYPGYKNIADYNLQKTLLKQGHAGVMNLHRGSKPENERRDEEKHCPFESLGYDCPLITK
jgi:hypothetical protein